MHEDPRLAEIAALVGDPARANILTALLDGRALTASELAYFAGVSPQTTSGHLAKLTPSRMLALQKQGRHRYYRLATPQVARMIESIMEVAVGARRPLSPTLEGGRGAAQRPHLLRPFRRPARRRARRCAGRQAAMSMLADEGGEVTEAGVDFLAGFGLDLADARRRRRRPIAAPASTGPSAARISAAPSARRSPPAVSRCAGSSASATAVPFLIPPPAAAASTRCSASRCD